MFLIFGAHNTQKKEDGQVRMESREFVIHKDYKPGYRFQPVMNDIALIKLPRPINETDTIKIVNIRRTDESYEGAEGNNYCVFRTGLCCDLLHDFQNDGKKTMLLNLVKIHEVIKSKFIWTESSLSINFKEGYSQQLKYELC